MSLIVGVIGGMGPAATLDFIARVRRLTPARVDQDHLRLLVDDNPTLPNRNLALAGQGPRPGPALAAMAAGLQRSGADFLVMPCNTAHAFRADIERAVSIPFLGMIETTLAAIPASVTRAGVLAVDGCLFAGLYQRALAEAGITPVLLGEADQRDFMDLISRIKAGDLGGEVRAGMRALALNLDAEAVIAGCTEVPLVLDAADLGAPLINSTEALAERTVAYARR